MKHKISAQIAILFLAIFFAGCQAKSRPNLSVYRTLATSLENSTAFVTSQNLNLYNSLLKKLAGQSASEKALYWYPKAMLIKLKCSEMNGSIDSLKLELKQEAGLARVNDRMTFREDDMKSLSNLFVKKAKGEKLNQELTDLMTALFAIDPEMTASMQKTISKTIQLSDPNEDKEKTFTETFFKDIPAAGGLAVLNKFQNDVKIVENALITFCDDKIPSQSN